MQHHPSAELQRADRGGLTAVAEEPARHLGRVVPPAPGYVQRVVVAVLQQDVACVLAEASQAMGYGPVRVTARRVASGAVRQRQGQQHVAGERAADLLLHRSSRLFQAADRVAEVALAAAPQVAGKEGEALHRQQPRPLADR